MPAPDAIRALFSPNRTYPAGFPPIDDHPVITFPDADTLIAWGEEDARRFLWERHWRIERMKDDPFHYGHILPHWKTVDQHIAAGLKMALIMGGNRSGKSEYAARKVMEILVNNPGKRAWCFQTTGPNSIEMQQPYLWRYMPKEWKNAKKGQVTDISYRVKTGFSEATFILPNTSQCWFRNYAQDISTIEGGEVDIIWFDELVPLDWVDTAAYRLVTRGGLMLITFTPVEGYSATVKDFLQGAKTITSAPAELLPRMAGNPADGYEMVPTLQQCAKRGAKIFYFHTADNPFSGWANLRANLIGERRENILCRAYGVPTKSIANAFPRFREEVHVIPEANIPAGGTWYHVNDPCNGRNFFMIWATVLPTGQTVIAREWPQADDYIEGIGLPGPWAEPDGKLADGKRGPAQKPFGFSLKRYGDEIRRVEGELARIGRAPGADASPITIADRWMDSRFGNTPTLQKESSTTLIEQMGECGIDYHPASGEHQQEGLDLINDALYYDDKLPIGPLNQPRLLVSERCQNIAFALKEWTGHDGKHGACKDPVDVLRYLLLADPEHIPAGGTKIIPGGSY